jgi:hypothetical protein
VVETPTTQAAVKETIDLTDESQHEVGSEQHVSPDAAFEQIMKTLAEPDEPATITIAELEKAMGEAKQDAANHKERADEAARKLETTSKVYDYQWRKFRQDVHKIHAKTTKTPMTILHRQQPRR